MRDVLITGNTVTSDTLTTERRRPGRQRGRAGRRRHAEARPHPRQHGDRQDERGARERHQRAGDLRQLRGVEPGPRDGRGQRDRRQYRGRAQPAAATRRSSAPACSTTACSTLRDTAVSHNSGRAVGAGGTAQGGGIWNGVLLTGPPVELTLDRSLVTGNSLTASPGIERSGGGVFTTEPIVRNRTLIAGNSPDQCFGLRAAAMAARTARRRVPVGRRACAREVHAGSIMRGDAAAHARPPRRAPHPGERGRRGAPAPVRGRAGRHPLRIAAGAARPLGRGGRHGQGRVRALPAA